MHESDIKVLPFSGIDSLRSGESIAVIVLLDEPRDTKVYIVAEPREAARLMEHAQDAARSGDDFPLVAYEPWQVMGEVKRAWHEYRGGKGRARND